ncbi:MAG TPA: hypothetical protein VFX15_09535 [Actinomycetes bacterium]|nr:hypothetical protein [Actinomycetes bacterium]
MSRRRASLVVLASVVVVSIGVGAIYLTRSDPSRAEAVLARLTIPEDWKLVDAEVDRGLVLGSTVTRYYLTPGDPETVAGETRSMLTAAGFKPEDRNGLPDCSSNHEPPHTTCVVSVPLTDSLWVMQWVVYDWRGAALIQDAPWLAEIREDQGVARVIINY